MTNTISVIIPVFNNITYLKETMDSVFRQTYKDYRIYIIDDSTENIEDKLNDLLLPYTLRYPQNIEMLRTNDIGATNARIKGIEECNSPYFMLLDADDYIAPKYMEETLEILENTYCGYVYVDTVYFNKAGQWRVPSPDYSFFNLIQNNFMSYCSLFDTEIFLSGINYNKFNKNYFEDLELYLRLGSRGIYGKHLPKDLFFYRVREDSSFQSERRKQFGIVYKAFIINNMPELFPLEWQREAKNIISKYPRNFMSLKPKEQEQYLEEK